MSYSVKTKTGSVYHINTTYKMWEQIEQGNDVPIVSSAPLRTTHGSYVKVSDPSLGLGLLIQCPPLVEGTIGRLIYTSDVVEIIKESE